MSARKAFSRALAAAAVMVSVAFAAGCQVEPAPIAPKDESAVKVAPSEIAPTRAAAPAMPEAPSAPAAAQPSSCCGGGACGQAQAKAEGAADCPCRAAAKAAGLPPPSCGGG